MLINVPYILAAINFCMAICTQLVKYFSLLVIYKYLSLGNGRTLVQSIIFSQLMIVFVLIRSIYLLQIKL